MSTGHEPGKKYALPGVDLVVVVVVVVLIVVMLPVNYLPGIVLIVFHVLVHGLLTSP